MTDQDHLILLLDEKADVDRGISSYEGFVRSSSSKEDSPSDPVQIALIVSQLQAMRQYSSCLADRIAILYRIDALDK